MLNHPGSINTVEWTIREREREFATPDRRFHREWRERGRTSRATWPFRGNPAQAIPTRPQARSTTAR